MNTGLKGEGAIYIELTCHSLLPYYISVGLSSLSSVGASPRPSLSPALLPYRLFAHRESSTNGYMSLPRTQPHCMHAFQRTIL